MDRGSPSSVTASAEWAWSLLMTSWVVAHQHPPILSKVVTPLLGGDGTTGTMSLLPILTVDPELGERRFHSEWAFRMVSIFLSVATPPAPIMDSYSCGWLTPVGATWQPWADTNRRSPGVLPFKTLCDEKCQQGRMTTQRAIVCAVNRCSPSGFTLDPDCLLVQNTQIKYLNLFFWYCLLLNRADKKWGAAKSPETQQPACLLLSETWWCAGGGGAAPHPASFLSVLLLQMELSGLPTHQPGWAEP